MTAKPHPIYAMTPFTLLDFPGKMACIIWVAGCNMRCQYCHNPQISTGHGYHSAAEVLTFLDKRRGLLDAVVISGGEATTWPEMPDFVREARKKGYAVKIDSNGLRPDVMKLLLDEKLIDFVALDYKAPLAKFQDITCAKHFDRFHETLQLLCAEKDVPFEVRTTVHTDLLNEDDINAIMQDLAAQNFKGLYAVQAFRADQGRDTLAHLPLPIKPFDFTKLVVPSGIELESRNFWRQ